MRFSIPIEILSLDDSSYHVFVSALINGEVCDLILDTGASKSVFALNHLNAFLDEKPIFQPEMKSSGINADSIESHLGILRTFSIGNLFLKDMQVVLIDLSSIEEIYRTYIDRPIWGLIGSDFLLKYAARLDYGKRTLSLNIPKSNKKVG